MTNIEKEWIAVDGEEVVERAETKGILLEKLGARRCPECGEHTLTDYEIVAVPAKQYGIFL